MGKKKRAQQHQITFFLMLFKELAVECFKFVERGKCLDTLTQLGITISDAKAEIMSLTYEDYVKGPEPDRDQGGDFWTFGRMIGGKEIFIRLKVVQSIGLAKCQSFHIAERPLEYPYKGGI